MKIAVTSASGKLGSAIIKALINEVGEENIVAIARTPERALHLGVEVRKGDYNNKEDFDAALKGVDKVLLVSGMDEPHKRIQQHRNVIEAAKENGVQKIVYTSIVGHESQTAFSAVVKSNRQTEKDVQASGLAWAIGRNGIYIEPDLEYIDTYIKEGGITNCAGDGECGYTSRGELAYAYAQMLLDDKHNGMTYNLVGEAISQAQLAEYINKVYDTNLVFKSVSVDEYENERKAALGEFIGAIIAGIYESISIHAYEVNSDYEKAAGRPHKSLLTIIENYYRIKPKD